MCINTYFEKYKEQQGNSRYHDQTAGVTGVATLVADRHAHVKDAQGVDEAGSEAQDVLDQLKGEIVTSYMLWLRQVLFMSEFSQENHNKPRCKG